MGWLKASAVGPSAREPFRGVLERLILTPSTANPIWISRPADDILVKVDRMSMAASIEAFPPTTGRRIRLPASWESQASWFRNGSLKTTERLLPARRSPARASAFYQALLRELEICRRYLGEPRPPGRLFQAGIGPEVESTRPEENYSHQARSCLESKEITFKVLQAFSSADLKFPFQSNQLRPRFLRPLMRCLQYGGAWDAAAGAAAGEALSFRRRPRSARAVRA